MNQSKHIPEVELLPIYYIFKVTATDFHTVIDVLLRFLSFLHTPPPSASDTVHITDPPCCQKVFLSCLFSSIIRYTLIIFPFKCCNEMGRVD